MNTDWLKQLAPAHAPPPISGWPPAPGWWMLGFICVSIVAGLAYWYWRAPSRLRRAALRELDHMQMHARNDSQLAGELQDLLRRYAVAVYGRETVASLSGADWLTFLASHGGTELAGEAGQSLLRAAYGSRFLYNDHGKKIAPDDEISHVNRTPWLQGVRGFLKGRR